MGHGTDIGKGPVGKTDAGAGSRLKADTGEGAGLGANTGEWSGPVKGTGKFQDLGLILGEEMILRWALEKEYGLV